MNPTDPHFARVVAFLREPNVTYAPFKDLPVLEAGRTYLLVILPGFILRATIKACRNGVAELTDVVCIESTIGIAARSAEVTKSYPLPDMSLVLSYVVMYTLKG